MAYSFIEFPIDGRLPAQSFAVTLALRQYRIDLYWSDRARTWSISLYTDSKEPILVGAKLLGGWAPFRQYRHALKPAGSFVVVDSLGKNETPGRDNFGLGRRFKLLFVEEAA